MGEVLMTLRKVVEQGTGQRVSLQKHNVNVIRLPSFPPPPEGCRVTCLDFWHMVDKDDQWKCHCSERRDQGQIGWFVVAATPNEVGWRGFNCWECRYPKICYYALLGCEDETYVVRNGVWVKSPVVPATCKPHEWEKLL